MTVALPVSLHCCSKERGTPGSDRSKALLAPNSITGVMVAADDDYQFIARDGLPSAGNLCSNSSLSCFHLC